MIFSETSIAKLFGQEAAEDEDFDRLQSYYVKHKTHEKVTADLPLRILVGHKGIGKSAIFSMARYEDEENSRLAILLRPDDICAIGNNEADFSKLIRDWKTGLTEIILAKILEHLDLSVDGRIGNIDAKELIGKGGKILSFVINMFRGWLEDKSINLTNSAQKIIDTFLKSNRIIVYIDDLDRGWQSKRVDIIRISALLNAARDMSNDNKGLRFRISLRTDVYYLVRTADESTDKIENNVIWHSWTNHEILVLLVKRIESFFNRDHDIDSLLRMEQKELAKYLSPVFASRFEGVGKWANAPLYRILMSLIRKRPRDLVKLCTLAARDAYDNNNTIIQTENLQKIFDSYSIERIQDAVNEYKSELPEVERLLLNMKPSTKELKEGKGWIYDTNALKNKIHTIIERGAFKYTNGRSAQPSDLLQFLYKINFVTARKDIEGTRIERKYFEENKYISSSMTDYGFKWEIHPAFRWALCPASSGNLYKDIDLG